MLIWFQVSHFDRVFVLIQVPGSNKDFQITHGSKSTYYLVQVVKRTASFEVRETES